MVNEEKARLLKIVRPINVVLLVGFVVYFWVIGTPPWWAAIPAALLVAPALDHHYAGCSTPVLVVVLLILGGALMTGRRRLADFEQLDTDGDGLVTVGEYERDGGVFRSENDRNGDGHLSLTEFLRLKEASR